MRVNKLDVYFIEITWYFAQYRIAYYDFAQNEIGADIVDVISQATFDKMHNDYPYLISIEDRTRGSRHD